MFSLAHFSSFSEQSALTLALFLEGFWKSFGFCFELFGEVFGRVLEVVWRIWSRFLLSLFSLDLEIDDFWLILDCYDKKGSRGFWK